MNLRIHSERGCRREQQWAGNRGEDSLALESAEVTLAHGDSDETHLTRLVSGVPPRRYGDPNLLEKAVLSANKVCDSSDSTSECENAALLLLSG